MTEPTPKRLELEAFLTIDQICDEFEQQRASGSQPTIEEFLKQIETKFQSKLFEQILPIELESLDSHPLSSDYVDRFPQFETQVQAVFSDLQLLEWTDSKIGRYQIVGELGRGGMGVVFRAKDPNLGRDIAIKLLNAARRSDSRWLRRFREEARIASGLNHPNILTIHEIGEDRETPFIASEFVDGVTLRREVSERRLSVHEALQYASQIASGMTAAHRAGIIHRDLKADNIMVRRDGLIKILDFGLAKQIMFDMDMDKSRTGAITGSVHFMSPEQARGQTLTGATDVFSFGVVMYLMVTGKLPFRGPSMSDAISKILSDQPRSIRNANADVPLELEELILRCLEKDADQRPTFADIEIWIETICQQIDVQEFEHREESYVAGSEFPKSLTARSWATQEDIETDSLQPSEIRYAQSGDINIAWQEIGKGPIDIVFVMGWVSHLEWFWKDPSFSKFLKRLATFARVILFDKRGTGLSDKVPVNQLPDLETRMDDVRAVMEAANSQHAVLCGVSEGGPLCSLFAATYPDKTIALTMIGSYSRRLWAEDYPWGPTAQQREEFLEAIGQTWGGPVGIEERAPSAAGDPEFRQWWASYLRMGASPGAAMALTKMNAQIDVRRILPSIHVPTLVIHRSGDRCLRVEEGRYLADKIPSAKFVELPGDDHLPFVGDANSIVDEIESFLIGMSGGAGADCVLATVLCVEVSDADISQLDKLRKHAKREIALYRGQNYFTDDESLLVTFDGPVRSVLCALAICKLAKELDLEIRCGLETGTCNIDKSVIYGPAVDGAKEVVDLAPAASVRLTSTLRNLISGSEIQFESVGEPGDLWQASRSPGF